MRAAVLDSSPGSLSVRDVPMPSPGRAEVLIRVSACGVCRTDLHIIDGELRDPKLPLVPGHQIVGTIVRLGPGAAERSAGERVGVPWLGYACGRCRYCIGGRENLCDHARFTGYQVDGGFAEYAVADERFCFPLPAGYPDLQAAPLLCAGLIGFRALRMAGNAARVGFYGFGSAAHILVQVARSEGRKIFAFTRPGDHGAQSFAVRLGADWAGDSTAAPPEPLDAALIFAPDGGLLPLALRAVAKGGIVICAGIHMSDIPSFPYSELWEERTIRSVANLTRRDAVEFLAIAPTIPVATEIETFPLADVNAALQRLRSGMLNGSAVIDLAA
jgi:alcohol dehydrogenase, propanol-preferring